jgi:hypothetical protein
MSKPTKKDAVMQPRIAPDVKPVVLRSSKLNSRTIPAEVNHVLRQSYRGIATPITP